nr:hypothetical protein [Bryobacterales bacterium]
VSAQVAAISHRMEVDHFHRVPATGLSMNEIADVLLETASPLFVDPYRQNRQTGAVVLVDPISNNTVAAGMIHHARPDEAAERRRRERSVTFTAGRVTALERQHRYGHRPALVLLEDAVDAEALERACFDRGWLALWIDHPVPTLHAADAWLRAALGAGNLVLLSRCRLEEGALPDGVPVLRVAASVGARDAAVRHALAQLAAWGVVPAEDQAGDGEGI